jgi:MFS family permease
MNHLVYSARKIRVIYLAMVLLSLQSYLVIYINSSFLEKFVSESSVGILYIVASLFNLVLFFNISKVIKKIGNFKLSILLCLTALVGTIGMAFSNTVIPAVVFFVLYQAVIPAVFFSLDIFLEHYSTSEKNTGSVRGLYLTLSNLALVLSPLIVSLILTNGDYYKVYFLSALVFVPLLVVLKRSFGKFPDAPHKTTNIIFALKDLRANKNIWGISVSKFVLEIFYSWMVIYTPLYLHQYIGLSWQEIGILFTIMLLPFVLFELPIGKIADKVMGEKEILIIGFLIMAVSTFSISFINSRSMFVWASVLFLTRMGASFVEITTESYFFKHVKDKDVQNIAIFRSGRPFSYIIGPALGSALLLLVSHRYLYAILGVMVLFGVKYSLSIKDTK